jgi:hypothetical protein
MVSKHSLFIVAFLGLFSLSLCAYAANSTPQVIGLTPTNETWPPESEKKFTATYSDPDGADDIQFAMFGVGNSQTNPLGLIYRQEDNKIYLLKDFDPKNPQNGIAPQTPGTLEDSGATLDCLKTNVKPVGNNLIIEWFVTFKKEASPSKYRLGLYTIDNSWKRTGWRRHDPQTGAVWIWTVNHPTKVLGVTPVGGSCMPEAEQLFTTTHSDGDGAGDIWFAMFAVGNSSTTPLYALYRQDWDKIFLYKDYAAGDYDKGVTPKTPGTLEDAGAILDCSKTTVTPQGNDLIINWAVTFKNEAGSTSYKLCVYTMDYIKSRTGWVRSDPVNGIWRWTVEPPDTTPPEITSTQPIKKSKFYAGDSIEISANVNDVDPSPLEYQFSIDGQVVQPWSATTSYNWATNTAGIGKHEIQVEVKDAGGSDSEAIPVYILRRPVWPSEP